MSKIAIPKTEYYQDQKRCIPLVKFYLRDYLVMGIVTMNLLKKLTVSTIKKILPVAVGSLSRGLQLEHQTLLDWHDISLQPIHLR